MGIGKGGTDFYATLADTAGVDLGGMGVLMVGVYAVLRMAFPYKQDEAAQGIRLLLSRIERFSRIVIERPLRRYWLEPAAAGRVVDGDGPGVGAGDVAAAGGGESVVAREGIRHVRPKGSAAGVRQGPGFLRRTGRPVRTDRRMGEIQARLVTLKPCHLGWHNQSVIWPLQPGTFWIYLTFIC